MDIYSADEFNKLLQSPLKRLKRSLLKNMVIVLTIFFRLLPKRISVAVMERTNLVGRLDYCNHDIYLSIDSTIEYNTRLNSCKKEPETIRWIEKYVQPDDIVYDIGANVGAYSLVVNKYTDGKATVYAFEPSVANYAKLVKNIHLNQCQDSIIPLPIALSNNTCLLKFNYSDLTPGAALHSLGRPINNIGMEFSPVFIHPVISYRLDDLINAFNIHKPNHLKLDVDGIELEILKGADHLLDDPDLKSIIVELEPSLDTSSQIIEYLNSKGFYIESMHPHGSEKSTTNYIFLH